MDIWEMKEGASHTVDPYISLAPGLAHTYQSICGRPSLATYSMNGVRVPVQESPALARES